LLQSPDSSSPCSDAVAHLTTLFDRTVLAAKHTGLACRQGCAHCCQQPVTVSAPEAFFVAAQIKSRPGAVLAITHANRRPQPGTQGYSPMPCPLLDDAACSVYAARPLACRGFVSRDVMACRTFEQFGKPNVPMPADYISVLYACRMILIAAVRLAGLKDAAYDMNEAVAAALGQENSERRWLGGEAVFAGVKSDGPPPPQFDSEIDRMAAYVARTL
jgi:Fe-S-cluster containining protein